MSAGTIVIPAYNEAARVRPAVESALAWCAAHGGGEVLVADDGSTDDTVAVAEAAGARVLRLVPNQGKGAAVRAGMLAATGDPVLFADADLSTPIGAWDALRARHAAGADVVIGVRTRESVSVPQAWPRVALGKVANGIVRALLLPGRRDTQCGFKSFRLAAARTIFSRLTIARFGFDVEALVIARRHGLRVDEVAVPWANDPRSRVRAVRDAWRTFAEVLAIRWRLARGRYDP